MKVLFDIGNSRIKWAWFEQGRNSPKEPFSLQGIGGANHAECSLDDIASTSWRNRPQPAQVVVSSVAADEHWRQLRDWCARYWRQTPLRVTSSAEGYGVRNAYAQPENLGSDRWAAIIGAHHLRHTDTCIIDCGTAITVDFLDAAGHHLGGYIMPGLGLMQRSLVQRTEAIQLLSQPEDESEIGPGCSSEPGKSTVACTQHGLLMAVSGMIEKACKKMEIQTGKSFCCLLTGGNAKWLAPCLAGAVELEPHLVLLGLAQIASEHHSSGITNRDTIKR